jgi:hypothetical protein
VTFADEPIIFEHVHFIYNTTERQFKLGKILLPDYICYNEKLCGDFLPATIRSNNLTRRHFHELDLRGPERCTVLNDLTADVKNRFRKCLMVRNDTHYCNHATMYPCLNSTKCILKHRLVDRISDCPFNDDATFNKSCSLNNTHHRFTCVENNYTKCQYNDDEIFYQHQEFFGL